MADTKTKPSGHAASGPDTPTPGTGGVLGDAVSRSQSVHGNAEPGIKGPASREERDASGPVDSHSGATPRSGGMVGES